MDERLKANLDAWNQMAGIHAASREYRLAEFKAGENVLKPIELREVGDVRGKSLLHMQCHFGLDTMSWARLGANVTGVDFSDEAIALARSISAELKIPARFLQSNIYDAPDVLHEQFDIVFTSYGALCWLPDIKRWAEIAASFVKPGGFFYIAEFHPLTQMSANRRGHDQARIRDFVLPHGDARGPAGAGLFGPEQNRFRDSPSGCIGSATSSARLRRRDCESSICTSSPECIYQHFPFMKQGSDGLWHIEGDPIPTIFSIKATKA